MSWEGLAGSGVTAAPSPAESQRFGLGVARVSVGAGTPPGAAATGLAKELAESTADLVVVRWPSEQVALAATVAASGRIVLAADVLMYWEMSAQALSEVVLPESDGLRVEPGSAHLADGQRGVEEVVRASFAAYGNHYSANPALDPGLALAGYLEWASKSFSANPDDAIFLLQGTEPIGVATLEQDSAGHDLEVLLAGLVPGAQGRGDYAHLLRAVGAEALRRDRARVVISTQAHNVRVQRAWARLGFRPFAAVTTAHAIKPGTPTAEIVLGQRSW